MALSSRLAFGVLGAKVTVPSGAEIAELGDAIGKYQTAVDELEERFAVAVADFLKTTGSEKLVVFIDDLDRCLPENVITVLESLKLFMDSSPCVFVLGVDRVTVEIAVGVHYGATIADLGRNYLDKIVHVPFSVPDVTQERLLDIDEHFAWETFDQLSLLAQGADLNPRLFARIMTAWRIVYSQMEFDPASSDQEKVLVAAVSVIRVRFPRLHELLRLMPTALAYLWDASRTARPLADTDFTRDGMAQFAPFWQDAEVRRVFGSITQGRNLTEINDLVEKVLSSYSWQLSDDADDDEEE